LTDDRASPRTAPLVGLIHPFSPSQHRKRKIVGGIAQLSRTSDSGVCDSSPTKNGLPTNLRNSHGGTRTPRGFPANRKSCRIGLIQPSIQPGDHQAALLGQSGSSAASGMARWPSLNLLNENVLAHRVLPSSTRSGEFSSELSDQRSKGRGKVWSRLRTDQHIKGFAGPATTKCSLFVLESQDCVT
jgi:hypothetical protein